MRATWVWCVIVALTACGGERAPTQTSAPQPVTAALGGTIVARVGDTAIERSLVVAVARAQGVSAELALQRLIDDVLLASSAQQHKPETRNAEAAVLARALITRLKAEALARGDFTDQELAAQLPNYWLELDRPEKRTVVHALIAKKVPNGKDLAQTLHKELVGSKDEADFTARAKAFKVDPPVHVEKFAIVSDGRLAQPGGGGVVEPFTKGTFAVTEIPGTSEVVETEFGWHIIRVLDREPPQIASRQEKIAKMRHDLIGARVKTAQDELLGKLQAATKIELVATDHDLLLPR